MATNKKKEKEDAAAAAAEKKKKDQQWVEASKLSSILDVNEKLDADYFDSFTPAGPFCDHHSSRVSFEGNRAVFSNPYGRFVTKHNVIIAEVDPKAKRFTVRHPCRDATQDFPIEDFVFSTRRLYCDNKSKMTYCFDETYAKAVSDLLRAERAVAEAEAGGGEEEDEESKSKPKKRVSSHEKAAGLTAANGKRKRKVTPQKKLQKLTSTLNRFLCVGLKIGQNLFLLPVENSEKKDIKLAAQWNTEEHEDDDDDDDDEETAKPSPAKKPRQTAVPLVTLLVEVQMEGEKKPTQHSVQIAPVHSLQHLCEVVFTKVKVSGKHAAVPAVGADGCTGASCEGAKYNKEQLSTTTIDAALKKKDSKGYNAILFTF